MLHLVQPPAPRTISRSTMLALRSVVKMRWCSALCGTSATDDEAPCLQPWCGDEVAPEQIDNAANNSAADLADNSPEHVVVYEPEQTETMPENETQPTENMLEPEPLVLPPLSLERYREDLDESSTEEEEEQSENDICQHVCPLVEMKGGYTCVVCDQTFLAVFWCDRCRWGTCPDCRTRGGEG